MKAEWTNKDSLTQCETTKAILVFETDDDISKLHADIYKEDEKGNGEIVLSYLPLRPMPKKRELKSMEYLEHYRLGLTGTYEREAYSIGFNDAINELGETE